MKESTCKSILLLLLAIVATFTNAFLTSPTTFHTRSVVYQSSSSSAAAAASTSEQTFQELKKDLVALCKKEPKASNEDVSSLIQDLENAAELAGVGQASALSGLLNGEWDLIYATDDVTRSSPFFWAFRKAFPENSDQIFGITDSIPSPIKDVGPATQVIDMSVTTQKGSFVSRVKVATLGGVATSMMTTRCSIVGIDGLDGIQLKIETTKPEDSTVVNTVFGPLGNIINDNAPPFPSGEALERAKPGSSQVVLRNTFCDEGLRITRNDQRPNDVYVWIRKNFASYDTI